jgi:integrase
MLLTLARRSEVVAMRHRDVDLEAATWTLADTKNGQRHVVQLSNQAAALLRARMPADAAPDALVFTTGEGAALGHWDRETKAIHKASRTAGWTRHDLRRTGATMLCELGEMPDIVEAALNHVSIRSPLAATYNRSRYAPAVRAALQRLADQLDQIAAGAGSVAKRPGAAPASDHHPAS